jgi:acyl-CoA synthetase (AMP-forming)/AMP-acid ligase II
MAPSLLDPPSAEAISAAKLAPTLSSNSNTAISSARAIKVCSDPSILPSDKASKRTRDLWWLHGHPHSTRYSDPKLVSLAALVRYAGQEYKGQTAFLYPVRADATTPYQSMTWDEFDAATEKIALRYAYQLRMELEKANATHRQPTIAILGAGRTLEYFCTEVALQKLGVRVLLLAESNSLSGFHHLLESCEALVVITDLKNAGINTNGIRKLQMIDDIPKGTETHHTDIAGVKFQDFGDVWERHTFIIHSSGSTGMPKPIIHTNRSMMLIARMYRLFQEFAIENWFLLFPL